MTPSRASARAQRAGPARPVRKSAFLDTMELVVSSAAVALMEAYVTGSQATASAQLAGLGTSVRAPVPRACLEFTVKSIVRAGEVPPATMSPGPASVPQDGGAHSARMPAHVAGLGRPVPSIAAAHLVPPATMLLESAVVPLASLDLAVSRPASLAPLERTVGTYANVLVRPGPATLLQGPVYALPVTMASTVSNDAHLDAMGQAVNKFVSVSMAALATRPLELATALLDSWGLTAALPVHRVASVPTVPMCVRVGKGRPVILCQGRVSVLLGRLESTVNMGVPRIALARAVSSSVSAGMAACVMLLMGAVPAP